MSVPINPWLNSCLPRLVHVLLSQSLQLVALAPGHQVCSHLCSACHCPESNREPPWDRLGKVSSPTRRNSVPHNDRD